MRWGLVPASYMARSAKWIHGLPGSSSSVCSGFVSSPRLGLKKVPHSQANLRLSAHLLSLA